MSKFVCLDISCSIMQKNKIIGNIRCKKVWTGLNEIWYEGGLYPKLTYKILLC